MEHRTEPLLVDIETHVAVVTLNRPHARNALDTHLRRLIHTTLSDLDSDSDVEAIILTGADPAFCAGIDLKELAASPSSLGDKDWPDVERRSGPIPRMVTPLIGAINGVAITGGFELALACDFLVASERASFADTHARVGIMPAWGLTVRLPEAVGLRRAREMSVTGNFIDAARAYEWGLVNRVVPHDQLIASARGIASDIAGNDRNGVAEILRTYHDGSLVNREQAFTLELERSREWLDNRDSGDLDARRRAVTERGRSQI